MKSGANALNVSQKVFFFLRVSAEFGKLRGTEEERCFRQKTSALWPAPCTAWTMQESYLFSDTIENNIGFAVDQPSSEKVMEAAKMADVHKNIVKFKEEYKTRVGERGVMLSGGQKQRICIARALIKEPSILIFDDSLSALDTETEENILQNIEKYIHNSTSVIITHRESSAKRADKILNLTAVEKGKSA